jgi:hypothetical protein
MAASRLLSASAAIEAAIGVGLIILPQPVASLLLGAELDVVGTAVARVAGIALLSLAVVCWSSRLELNQTPALVSMLTYNVLVTAFLLYLGLSRTLVGRLLWPVIGLHAFLALLFAYARFSALRTKTTTP